MSSPDNNEEEESLSDIITSKSLPITVRVTRTCTLRDEPVLIEGQTITVLDKKWVHLMSGRNWHHKMFRLEMNIVSEEVLNVVEEFYPSKHEDIMLLKDTCDYLQIKIDFKICYYEFQNYDKFTLNDVNTDVAELVHKKTGVVINVPIKLIMDINTFVFIKLKDTMVVNELLQGTFKPVTVEFQRELSCAPKGVVMIEELPVYDVILITTLCDLSYIKYEMFPLHLGIKACRLNQLLLPGQLSSDKMSEEYRQHLKEIEFSMFFDIYQARYHGYVIMEDTYRFRPFEQSVGKVKSSTALVKKSKSFGDIEGVNENGRPYVIEHEMGLSDFRRKDKDQKKKQLKLFASLRRITSPTREKSKPFPRQSSFPLDANQALRESNPYLQETDSSLKNIVDKRKELTGHYSSLSDLKEKISPTQIKNIETTNPLYDTLVRPEKLTRNIVYMSSSDAIALKTAKSNKDNSRRLQAFPISNSFFFNNESPVSGRKVSESTEPLPSVQEGRPALDINVSRNKVLGARKQAFQSRLNRASSQEYLISNDSGIDSPESKKSFENVYETSVEQLRMYFDSGLHPNKDKPTDRKKSREEKTTKPTIAKKSQLISNKQTENSVFYQTRCRSASDPLLDMMNSEFKAKERPKSYLSTNHTTVNTEDGEEHLYEPVIYSDVKKPLKLPHPFNQKEIDSYDEIKSFTVDNVIEMLKKIKLENHEAVFRQHLVNGPLILDSTEKTFSEMNLTTFESRKLYKYIHGWRPNETVNCSSSFLDIDFKKWSVQETSKAMKLIKLDRIGMFCEEHKVDGELLLDLVETGIMNHLDTHGVKLMEIEWKRLKGFIKREINLEVETYC